MTIGMLILSVSLVRSVFKPNAQMRTIKLKVGDFVAPPVVELERGLIMTLKGSSQISWTKVNDYKEASGPVYYRLSIAGKEYKVNDTQFLLDNTLLTGDHVFKVRACDQINNCSNWSSEGLLSLINPVLIGDVYDEDEYFQLSNSMSINFWYENYLELSIDNDLANQIEFDYLTESNEELAGFDQTKLVVSINDEIVFAENRSQDNWNQVILSLRNDLNKPINIKFYSGNQGDRQSSSWVKIKNINIVEKISEINNDDDLIIQEINELGIVY